MRLWRSKRGCCQVIGHKKEVKCSQLILKRKVNSLNEPMQADHPWKCWEVTCSLFFHTVTSCVWCHWILDLGNLHLFFLQYCSRFETSLCVVFFLVLCPHLFGQIFLIGLSSCLYLMDWCSSALSKWS